MTPLRSRRLRAAFGDRLRAERAARAAHHVQGRRSGGLAASRRARATRSRRRSPRARAGVPVTMLGGGSNVLVADAACAGWSSVPRGGDVRPPATTASVRMLPLRSTASSAGRSTTAAPDWKRGPGRRARSAARSSATRTSGAADRRARDPVRAGQPGRRVADVRGRPHGVRLRSQPPAATPAKFCCPPCFACRRGRSRRRCGRSRDRSRSANGRSRSTRQAPAASFKTRARTRCRA